MYSPRTKVFVHLNFPIENSTIVCLAKKEHVFTLLEIFAISI